MKYFARWVAAFSCIVFPLLVQASSSNLPAHGGNGGSSFRLDCGNDKVLVGASGRKGDWLDRLQARCIRVSSDGKWVGTLSLSSSAGGSGREGFTVTCPRNTAATGISGRFGWYVNGLDLRCEPLGASGSSSTVRVSGSQSGEQSFGEQSCPNGKPARGFYGRAGTYIDRTGLICHAGTTPQLQVLAAPDRLVAVNLVNPQTGPSTTTITPFVQLQWTDRSTIESGFRLTITPLDQRSGSGTIIDRPAAAGAGTRQAVTMTNLPTGGYLFRACARFNAADGGDRCSTAGVPFGIVAASTCGPTITSAERIGAGTGRVRWSHGCNDPTRFAVKLRCGNSPFLTVATTADGTAREETFNFGVGSGLLQVCALFPGQSETAFCSAQTPFQCN